MVEEKSHEGISSNLSCFILELHFKLICTCSVLSLSLLYIYSVNYYTFVCPFFFFFFFSIFFFFFFFFPCEFSSHGSNGTEATHWHIWGLGTVSGISGTFMVYISTQCVVRTSVLCRQALLSTAESIFTWNFLSRMQHKAKIQYRES